jgi:hypothetical protein
MQRAVSIRLELWALHLIGLPARRFTLADAPLSALALILFDLSLQKRIVDHADFAISVTAASSPP